jgi:hypothetical protein
MRSALRGAVDSGKASAYFPFFLCVLCVEAFFCWLAISAILRGQTLYSFASHA